jgi:hypothetical protein
MLVHVGFLKVDLYIKIDFTKIYGYLVSLWVGSRVSALLYFDSKKHDDYMGF